jgi:hypothetical protein
VRGSSTVAFISKAFDSPLPPPSYQLLHTQLSTTQEQSPHTVVTQLSILPTDTISTEPSISPTHIMVTRPSSPVRTFHPFPRLTAELRCQIWAYALPESLTDPTARYPHYVSIQLANTNDSITNVYRSDPRCLHPLFYVNRESRSEAARTDGGKWFAMEFREPHWNEPTYGRMRVCVMRVCFDANKGEPSVYFNKNKEVVQVRQWSNSSNPGQFKVLGQGDIC